MSTHPGKMARKTESQQERCCFLRFSFVQHTKESKDILVTFLCFWELRHEHEKIFLYILTVAGK